jgi:transposase
MSPMSPPSEIGIKGYRILRYQSKPTLELFVQPIQERPPACPCCGGDRLHSKGRYVRRARHLESFGRFTRLRVTCRRFRCLECAKSFVQPLPGILPGRHSTEPFRERIYRDHHDGICGTRLAKLAELGSATVERIYHQFTRRKASERISLQCPEVLGIDEHTLHKGCRFATTFCDLKRHRVFDIAEGKSSPDLQSFLRSLQGRDKVRVVCIDMSASYRSLVERYFPKARIVADRFHVIRLIQHHFMELCRQVAPILKHHRGWLAALRKHPGRLTNTQSQRLKEIFGHCPAIQPLYDQMQRLCSLMRKRHQKKRQCRELAPRLIQIINQLAHSGFSPLVTLANTLRDWQEPIACMWRFTKNNGITEGFHRKMKLIQRRAYGFRNFNNYRLRVIAQCG